MINKQNLWFAMLFSVILVLSIFYVSMNDTNVSEFVSEDTNQPESNLVISESTELVSLRVANDEELQNTMNELKDTLLSDTATIEEKNDAYNELLALSDIKGVEEKLEKILNDEFDMEAFVKVSSTGITVVVESKTSTYEDANKIIRRIQKEFKEEKYITVKFN